MKTTENRSKRIESRRESGGKPLKSASAISHGRWGEKTPNNCCSRFLRISKKHSDPYPLGTSPAPELLAMLEDRPSYRLTDGTGAAATAGFRITGNLVSRFCWTWIFNPAGWIIVLFLIPADGGLLQVVAHPGLLHDRAIIDENEKTRNNTG